MPMSSESRLLLLENNLGALYRWASALRTRLLSPNLKLADAEVESQRWRTLEMLLGRLISEQPWSVPDEVFDGPFDTPVKTRDYGGGSGDTAHGSAPRFYRGIPELRVALTRAEDQLSAAQARLKVLDELVGMIPFDCFLADAGELRDVLEAQAELVRRAGLNYSPGHPVPPDENRGVVYSSAFGACPNCGGTLDHTPNCAKREGIKLPLAEAPKTPETSFSGYVALDGEQPRPLAARQGHDLDLGATVGTPGNPGPPQRRAGPQVWCSGCMTGHGVEEYRIANRVGFAGVCGHGIEINAYCSQCLRLHRIAQRRQP